MPFQPQSFVYYDYLRTQWIKCMINEINVENAVTKGYITQQEADQILATPRIC